MSLAGYRDGRFPVAKRISFSLGAVALRARAHAQLTAPAERAIAKAQHFDTLISVYPLCSTSLVFTYVQDQLIFPAFTFIHTFFCVFTH